LLAIGEDIDTSILLGPQRSDNLLVCHGVEFG
jgi:hypothetical protein